MSSPFDMDQFMNSSSEGPGSTTITPVPVGEYFATIDENVKAETYSRKDGSTGLRLALTFNIIDNDGSIKAAMDGRDPKLTHSYFVDTTPQMTLDMSKGKNVQLNRLREALSQNGEGAWNVSMLRNAGPLKISVKHEPRRDDTSILDPRLKDVARA